MAAFATRRLIDAAGTLEPADRALLNLWITRGLDDERLTALTGLPSAALEARRARIVDQLAETLGLPGGDVRDALDRCSPEDWQASASAPNGAAAAANGAATTNGDTAAHTERPSPTEPVPVTEGAPAEGPSDTESAPAAEGATSAQTAESPPSRPRRGGAWLAALAAAVVVIAIVAIALASGGTSHLRRTPARTASATTSTSAPQPSTTASATTSTPSTTPTSPGAASGTPLAGLPGGLAHATGSVRLLGRLPHLKLQLTVRGLPAAVNGYHEVWLYNSVIDSQPLGRLRTGVQTLTVALPRDARRFLWIDISFQPSGDVNHSGESELRATNPAHTTRARLRRPAAHRRHRLRSAAVVAVSATPRLRHRRPPVHRRHRRR